MDNRDDEHKIFISQYEQLIKNVGIVISEFESDYALLKYILSKIPKIECIIQKELAIHKDNNMCIHLLTMEMEFLNNYKNKNKNISKWLKAVEIVLNSIGNYVHIPLLDIAKEIVQIYSILRPHSKNGYSKI